MRGVIAYLPCTTTVQGLPVGREITLYKYDRDHSKLNIMNQWSLGLRQSSLKQH
jgi:hypothetical protein